MIKIHWHLHYTNRTACGILAYRTDVIDEYDTAKNGRIECASDETEVTCQNCCRVMMLRNERDD